MSLRKITFAQAAAAADAQRTAPARNAERAAALARSILGKSKVPESASKNTPELEFEDLVVAAPVTSSSSDLIEAPAPASNRLQKQLERRKRSRDNTPGVDGAASASAAVAGSFLLKLREEATVQSLEAASAAADAAALRGSTAAAPQSRRQRRLTQAPPAPQRPENAAKFAKRLEDLPGLGRSGMRVLAPPRIHPTIPTRVERTKVPRRKRTDVAHGELAAILRDAQLDDE